MYETKFVQKIIRVTIRSILIATLKKNDWQTFGVYGKTAIFRLEFPLQKKIST